MNFSETEFKLQWAKDNPSVCFLPYSTVDIRQPSMQTDTDISVSCCCNLSPKKLKYKSAKDPFKEIKEAAALGELPDACGKCKLEEQNGGQSERIRDILGQPKQVLEDFANNINHATPREFEVRIKFSSLCSLACRSCASTESTTYAKIVKDTYFGKLSTDISELDNYWDHITTAIMENIDVPESFYLHLIGGETFLQPGVIKLCNWLIEQNLVSRIKLRLTTSMAVVPSATLLEKFAQFNEVFFIMSIDSVGENYKYVRWPANFGKVERNLTDFIEYRKTLPDLYKFKFIISPVFSLNNIFYIDDYLTYWDQWLNRNNYLTYFVSTNLVMETNYLDVQALPVGYRSYLKDLLTTCLAHPIFLNKFAVATHIYTFIKSTIGELEHWPDNPKLWNNFLLHTAEFDRRTGTEFSILNSRLYNLLVDKDVESFNNKLLAVNTNKTFHTIRP